MLNLGVLVSGSGTNLQAIIAAIEGKRLSAKISVVISSNAAAYAVDRAKKHSLNVEVISDKDFPGKEAYDKKLLDVLKANGVQLIALAGFMRILSPSVINAFPMRIMNIHPSLLPAFPGLNVQKKALEYGARFSGATVHFVDQGVDTGPIIIQAAVPILDADTPEILAERILKEEHRIYPQAIQFFAEKRIELKGRRVFIKGGVREEVSLENPLVTIFDETKKK